MASSLSQLRKLGASRLVVYGQEAKNFLRSAGVRFPSEASIYVDPSGLVSYKGRVVRSKSGEFIPPASASMTAQGKATAAREASAANKRLSELAGTSRTVSSRKQLEAHSRAVADAKAQLPPKPPSRPQTPTAAPKISARTVRIQRPSTGVLQPLPKPRLLPAAAAPKPQTATPVQRPSASTPAASGFVRAQAVAVDYNGYTIIVLKPV